MDSHLLFAPAVGRASRYRQLIVPLMVAGFAALLASCAPEPTPKQRDPPTTILRSAFTTPEAKEKAITELRAEGKGALLPLVEDLTAQLRQDQPVLARLAKAALVELGSDSASPLVVAAESEQLRMMALQTLKSVTSPPNVVEKVAISAPLLEPVKRVRAVETLGAMARRSNLAQEKLAAMLADSDPLIRIMVLRELARVEDAHANIARLVAEKLDDSEGAVRREACLTLYYLGKNAVLALPRLKVATTNSEPEIRELAKLAFERINFLDKDKPTAGSPPQDRLGQS